MPEAESRLEQVLLAFLREPMLWPVLVAVVGHAVALLAPLLLLALRERRLASLAALLLLLGLSALMSWRESRLRGRPSPLSGLLWTTWLLAGGAAWIADRYEIF